MDFIWVEVSNNLRISSLEEFIVDKDLCVFFVRVPRSSLLFVTIEHWSAKKLLKILAFSLKSVTNLSWCSSGGMQGIFLLFRKVFNIDQYDFWLVLDLTIYEISECNIDSWILQLKSSTLFEETKIGLKNIKDLSLSM